jgi:hypothetical protein
MKLSLRELFLLVALAAMGCGWWLDHPPMGGTRTPSARHVIQSLQCQP